MPHAEAVCWGAAFRVESTRRGSVLAELDHRERGGFDRVPLALHLRDRDGPVEGQSDVVRRGNANYLGPAPLEALAEQLRRSRGPSGSNREYVLELAGALRRLDLEDAHVLALERALRET